MSRKSGYLSACLVLCALITFSVRSAASSGDASSACENLPPYQLGPGKRIMTGGVPVYGLVMMLPSLTPLQRQELQTIYAPFNKESTALYEQMLSLTQRNPGDTTQIHALEMRRRYVTRQAWQVAKTKLRPEQFKELRQLALSLQPPGQTSPYVHNY